MRAVPLAVAGEMRGLKTAVGKLGEPPGNIANGFNVTHYML